MKDGNSNEGSAGQNALKKAIDNLLNAPAYTDPMAAFTANRAAINVSQEEPPVTHEQWEQLYEVAKNIRLLAPWRRLHESQRITLLLPGRDEPVYIVVMGSGEMTYGIGVYPGYDSFGRLQKMVESEMDEENISAAFEQHCINLYFGDREELESKDKNVIKQLGLKFRGRNEWPYFRSMKPGFMPWYINHEEAELTIAALQNFAMACLAYAKNGLEIDFDNGETLLRFYDSEADVWYNAVIKMPLAPFIQPKMVITDDILINKLKKKRQSKAKLGLAITYIPMPVQEKNERPRIPRMAALADMGSGKLIDQVTDMEYETIGVAITELLTRYVEKNGRPASIAVSEEDVRDYIDDFATKLGIKLLEDERLSALGGMVFGMMESGRLDDFME
jgi:hypothetical protein